MAKRKFYLSEKSLRNREGVRPELIAISDRALELSPIDFCIPADGGFRSFKRQRELFNLRRSQCDGRFKISPHQVGYGLDFFAYVNGKASWEEGYLSAIAAAFFQAAGEQGIRLEWGGFWNNKKKPDVNGIRWGWDCGHIQLWNDNYGALYSMSQNPQIDTGE